MHKKEAAALLGKQGGLATKRNMGKKFYSEIGKKGRAAQLKTKNKKHGKA